MAEDDRARLLELKRSSLSIRVRSTRGGTEVPRLLTVMGVADDVLVLLCADADQNGLAVDAASSY